MNIFLTSQASNVLGDIVQRLPKQASKYRVAFVPTASNVYPDPWWVREDRDALVRHGFVLTELDIEGKSQAELRATLQGVDALFVAGGNTFYLFEKVLESGLASLIPELLAQGIIYIGSSAGSVILAPDIEPSKFFDEREQSYLEDTKGLHMVDFYPLPHYGKKGHEALSEKVLATYEHGPYAIVPMTDMQYFHVTDAGCELIDVSN